MNLIDSHAHLTFPELKDRVDETLERCESAGVSRVITVGTNLLDSKHAIDLAERYPQMIHAAAGIHPHEAKNVTETDLCSLPALWEHPAVIGIGEIGLDYHYDFSDPRVQQAVFSRQLVLAKATDLPLIIHCREALDDTIRLLVDHEFDNKRVVFHCFTGGPEEAERIAEQGWVVSFSGVVTFGKSTALQQVARTYPLDRLMVETDCPYLTPVPFRGQMPNEPAHLAHTVRFLADLRAEPYELLARHTSHNTREFFHLP